MVSRGRGAALLGALKVFTRLSRHGFGNWAEIAEFLSNGKTQEEV
jgi:hypothetical protein